jgi:hypothetical protein
MIVSRIAVAVGFICCISIPVFAEEATPPVPFNHFRVGAGIGIPYGGYGVNTEYRINRYVSVSAGLGYVHHEGPGWAVGAAFYPLKNDETFNPRISGNLGRVNTIEWTNNFTGSHRYEGVNGGTLGGGFEWRVYKMLSLDFDLCYVFEDLPAGVKNNDTVGASLGIGMVF